MKQKNEEKLPKWAQQRISDLRNEIRTLQNLKKLHALLHDEDIEWFTIRNIVAEHQKINTLWLLYPNRPHAVCSLGKDDILFIGRKADATNRSTCHGR